ncbi:MAG TPA: AMP-binding protein [Acidimicrobiales bacterium]|nr:AMP-binding protein [Acidimicrobiales bacterium]
MDLNPGEGVPADRWTLRTVPEDLEQRWLGAGYWDDRTLGEQLDRALDRHADQVFRVHSAVRPWAGTFGELRERSQRVAAALSDRGVRPGDPVAFQLPNWAEAATTFYAATFLGAVVVPIVHFYGPKEVGYILRRTGVRALVTAASFSTTDYLAALRRMGDALDGVHTIAVVGGTEEELGDGLVPFRELENHDGEVQGPAAVDPSSAAIIAYTSGTTADPKGVIHSHRTIGSEVRQLGAMKASGGRPTLTGAPVGHAIGMLGALLIPVLNGDPVHLVDVWDPPHLLAIMAEFRLACGSGATYFLTSLLDHPDRTEDHLDLMRHVGLGGSTVPSTIAERAAHLGISIVRMYGSTEHPSITGSHHSDPEHHRLNTDGRPLEGVEIRLLDDDGRPVGPGEPGEIWSRGPDCCMGYTDPVLTAALFDDRGWYRTEDIGVLDGAGYLTITDRRKDVIIRGGENVSAAEVEELLVGMEGIAEAAVVAAPHPRLGEQVCAFLRLAPDAHRIELDRVQEHLREAGLARQKWPEQLRVVEEFPRTPSGKLKKELLRQRLRDEARPGNADPAG